MFKFSGQLRISDLRGIRVLVLLFFGCEVEGFVIYLICIGCLFWLEWFIFEKLFDDIDVVIILVDFDVCSVIWVLIVNLMDLSLLIIVLVGYEDFLML